MRNLESHASPKQWGDRQLLGGEVLEVPTGLRCPFSGVPLGLEPGVSKCQVSPHYKGTSMAWAGGKGHCSGRPCHLSGTRQTGRSGGH